MFRLLGFLIGSVTSVIAILLVTGIPEFHLEDPAIDQKRFDDAVEKLMVRKHEAERAAQDLTDDIVQIAGALQDGFSAQESESFDEAHQPESVAENVREKPFEDATQSELELEDSPLVFAERSLVDIQWYSFWTPFHSQIAAGGFVARLEEVTGLDYRVVKIETGIYEVAFAYDSDDERRSKLSQISVATGLDLPES